MKKEDEFKLEDFEAVILDLDGVITRTAVLHARAWKRMFDGYLKERAADKNKPFKPFDMDQDYKQYVDGKPRYDGVRSFFNSRGISLPDGDPDDEPVAETVCGLGNRKNTYYHELLKDGGAEVYDDAADQIRNWRSLGLKTAVVSSSKNCALILESVGLINLFESLVDGVVAERLKLAGKPAPDIFLMAARELGVDPSKAIVIEDAVSGVQAGSAGNFRLVVGVAREGETDGEQLLKNGADIVVENLRELRIKGEKR